jgi:hypothetical protein
LRQTWRVTVRVAAFSRLVRRVDLAFGVASVTCAALTILVPAIAVRAFALLIALAGRTVGALSKTAFTVPATAATAATTAATATTLPVLIARLIARLIVISMQTFVAVAATFQSVFIVPGNLLYIAALALIERAARLVVGISMAIAAADAVTIVIALLTIATATATAAATAAPAPLLIVSRFARSFAARMALVIVVIV